MPGIILQLNHFFEFDESTTMDEEAPQNTPGHAGPLQIAPIIPIHTEDVMVVPKLPSMLLPIGNKHLLQLRNPTYEFNDLGAISTLLPMDIKKGVVDILLKHDEGTYHSQVGDVGQTVLHLCNTYNLTRATVAGWKFKIENHVPMKETRGKPRKIPTEVIESVRETAKLKGYLKDKGLTQKAVNGLIAEETRKRNLSEYCVVVDDTLSERTLRRARKEIGRMQTPKDITDARVRAAQDLRNYYSMYVMLQAAGSS